MRTPFYQILFNLLLIPIFSIGQNIDKEIYNEYGKKAFLALEEKESDTNTNLLFSPLSLFSLNGMLANAAYGETKLELLQTLGFTPSEIVLLNSYNMDLMKTLGKESIVKNALWYPKDYSLKTTFKKILEENYKAEIKSGDFNKKGTQVTSQINRWFYENTNHKINNMIESVSPMDKLILMNAIYFKSNWEEPFNPKMTHEGDFKLKDGSKVNVEFIAKTSKVKWFKNNTVQLLILPYKGDFEMVIFSTTLNIENFYLDEYENKLATKELHYEIPKFILKREVDCIELSKKMGIFTAFIPGADFSPLFKKTDDDLYISKMYQKSYLKIDEFGTEAAAASVAKVSRSMAMNDTDEIIFDTSFLFIIRHKASKAPLFIGKVNNPILN